MDFLNPGKNPYFSHSNVQLFMAYRDDKPVGRISAHENNQHLKVYKDDAGFFGFFECINDQETANALFGAASNWLREKGLKTMRGPASFSVNDEIGLLIDSFDKPPVLMMTYNPPYYVDLIEGYGFRKAQDLWSYLIFDENGIPDTVYRLAETALNDPNLVVRTVDMKNFGREVERAKKVYNRAWAENWGSVPMTDEEFDRLAKELKLVLDPDLAFIAEYNGEPVGISITLPDMNQAIKYANGRLFPFGLLKILWKKRKIETVRVLIMGVLKEYRYRGIDSVFYVRTYENGVKKGFKKGELSWILESNRVMNRILKKMGAKVYKTYRIYDFSLS
jgi:GNAT superfamily N-acetyltransferase